MREMDSIPVFVRAGAAPLKFAAGRKRIESVARTRTAFEGTAPDMSHQVPFFRYCHFPSAAVAAFPLNIILTIALALASYFLVERPSLQLRRWLERLRSPRPVPTASSGVEALPTPSA